MIELLLPVEREVVEILVGEDFAEEAWTPESAINDLWFGWLDDRGLKRAVPGDKFGADRALDVEVARFLF